MDGAVVTEEADTTRTAAAPASIAVLPFANRSGSSEDEYLSDGISEEILSALGRVTGLRVAARTSSFAFKGRDEDVRAIARALGVRHVLEGSVQRAGDRVRITVSLADAASGYQVWSQSYNRELRDVFALEDEIARTLADTLRRRLAAGGTTAARPTTDPQAHDLYLRGRYVWNRRTRAGLEQAAEFFREAIRADPSYAAAHAGLADAYLLLATYGFLSNDEAIPRAKAAAERAVALDPSLAEAHTSLAAVLVVERDYEGADRAYATATELNPNYATALHWHGFALGLRGRTEEALREVRRALDVDPLSLPIHVTLGRLLVHRGAPDAAVGRLERIVELDPAHPWTWYVLAVAHDARRRHGPALDAIEWGLERLPEEPRLLATRAAILVHAGHAVQAREILDRLRASNGGGATPYAIALVYAALGDHDTALRWLERVQWNSEYLFSTRTDPLLDPLRSDARFASLLRRLGLEE